MVIMAAFFWIVNLDPLLIEDKRAIQASVEFHLIQPQMATVQTPYQNI